MKYFISLEDLSVYSGVQSLLQNNCKVFFYNNNNGNMLMHQAAHKYPGQNGHIV